jgi:hypothetical protein
MLSSEDNILTDQPQIMKEIAKSLIDITDQQDEIAQNFKKKITPAQKASREKTQHNAKQQLKTIIEEGNLDHLETSKDISLKEVESAMSPNHLKNGKAGGPDNIMNEMLKAGGKKMKHLLWSFYSMLFQLSIVPADLQLSTMSMIHKKGAKDIVTNYRPITLTNTILKIYERILDTRLKHHLKLHATKNPDVSFTGLHTLQGASQPLLSSLDTIAAMIDELPYENGEMDFTGFYF